MLSFMLIFFLCMMFALIVAVLISRNRTMYDFDDEYEVTRTTTTTTTTVAEEPEQPQYIVVGKLQRQIEGTQYFVIDPADGEKIFVNNSDDMYRDANDRVWKLA